MRRICTKNWRMPRTLNKRGSKVDILELIYCSICSIGTVSPSKKVTYQESIRNVGKDCKRRAEQENTEILNYLSVGGPKLLYCSHNRSNMEAVEAVTEAIINDDIPEQYALMDGSVSAVPSGHSFSPTNLSAGAGCNPWRCELFFFRRSS